MKESDLDGVCEAIDKLTLRCLELMEEKVATNVGLEKSLRDGHINLAKTKYIRGKESIGILQVPVDQRMTSLFQLEAKYSPAPSYDISFKKANSEGEIDDPLKWFGVLVPQNLRVSQKHFQESVFLVVKAVNVQAELADVSDQLQRLTEAKRKLHSGK